MSSVSELLRKVVLKIVGEEYSSPENVDRYNSKVYINSHTDWMIDGDVVLTTYLPKVVQVSKVKYEFVQEYKLYS